MAQEVFERKEVKYLMDYDTYRELRKRLDGIAVVDEYGKTGIYNIYYDTGDFSLIQRSLSHPSYKEKLRLRSYGIPGDDSQVFIEIKKKYKGVVYKRRIDMTYREAIDFLSFGVLPDDEDFSFQEEQIEHEIEYFVHFYQGLEPAMAISYDRVAMAGVKNPELRITFDSNLRWSRDNLDMRKGNAGELILEPGQRLMEVKTLGSMDLELSHILSELSVFPVSFSKYGQGFVKYENELKQEQFSSKMTACQVSPV